jgi:NADH-quinone oxidoreductase subunit K
MIWITGYAYIAQPDKLNQLEKKTTRPKKPVRKLKAGVGMISLTWYLIFAAALFSIGLFGVLARKNAIAIFMGIELMLNAVNINLVAFWRYNPTAITGQAFAVMVFAVAAAEIAVGLALVISLYRRRSTVIADEINLMKW